MSHHPSQHEIEHLRREVHERISRENMAYEQWQIGVEENRKRRIDEIIFDVVRGFYGEIILPVVRQLRRLFSLE